MSTAIRLGIAGCGKIAQVAHAPGFAPIPGVRIAALMDPDTSRSAALNAKLAEPAAAFTDFDAFLASGLDAVTICTPNHLHAPMAVAALEKGLHVLCEKPIAGTLADADRMLAAAAKAGKVLQINQSLRYAPAYVTVAKLVAEGCIGEVMHIRCLRAGGRSPDQGWSPGASWFVSSKAQGGLLLDIGIHMADLMRWIAGEVESIAGVVQTRTAGIDVPDNVRALFRFRSGATGTLELSWTFPAGGGLLEVYGTRGSLRMGFGKEPIELIEIDAEGKPQTSHPEPVSGIANSYEAFVAAIRGEAPSPTPGQLGREALALCQAIADASQSGQFVAP